MKFIKKLGWLSALLVATFAVSACGSSSDETDAAGGSEKKVEKKSKNDSYDGYTIKELLESSSDENPLILYGARTDEGLAKDTNLREVFVFRGDNVTYYSGDLTFGDLSGMTDKEIISHLDSEKIKETQKGYESVLERNRYELTVDFSSPEWDDAKIAYLEAMEAAFEDYVPESVPSVPFDLTLYTDDSGNRVQSEDLEFEVPNLDFPKWMISEETNPAELQRFVRDGELLKPEWSESYTSRFEFTFDWLNLSPVRTTEIYQDRHAFINVTYDRSDYWLTMRVDNSVEDIDLRLDDLDSGLTVDPDLKN